MRFADRNPRLVYWLFLLAMATLFFVCFARYRMHIATIKEDQRVTIRVQKVVCEGNRNNQNYIVFAGEHSNHIVNVGKAACADYHTGDTVQVLYNSQHDLYFPLHMSTESDWWGMSGRGLGVLVAACFLIFRRKAR